MMKSLKATALTMVLWLMLTACGNGTGNGSDRRVTASFPGRASVVSAVTESKGGALHLTEGTENELEVGDIATILISASPPEDFVWMCFIPDDGVVEFIPDDSVSYGLNERSGGEIWLAGDGSIRTIRIKATSSGKAVIELTVGAGEETVQTREYSITVPAEPPPVSDIRILSADTPNTMKVGEIAKILEGETPSTGYLWHYEIPADGVVEFVYEELVQNNPDNTMPGGDGRMRVITVKAVKPGETVIELVEKRGDDEGVLIKPYRIIVVTE